MGDFVELCIFDSNIIPLELVNPLVLYWAVVAALFSLFTTVSIRRRYEKPMKHMGEVTKRVSEGDFTARLEVSHAEDKLDYLDVMFLDFNKMVEELARAVIKGLTVYAEQIAYQGKEDEIRQVRSLVDALGLYWGVDGKREWRK